MNRIFVTHAAFPAFLVCAASAMSRERVDRAAVHAHLAERIVAFLDDNLSGTAR